LDRDAHRVYDPTDPDDTVGRRLRRVNCLGTGTGPAIAHAALTLEHAVARGAEPVIVLVTDGVPCHVRFGRSSAEWVETGKQAAIDAALAARQRGIRIFVVDLSLPPFGPPDSCSADGSGFNTDLASHGFGTTTDDPVELKNKLLEVANKLTLRLVR
jgi:Mg-chelatase subunit ChlD